MNGVVEQDQANVQVRWGIRIPLRDGIQLSGALYLPKGPVQPSPVILTLTPYVGQTYHDQGVYFAACGYPFLAVDVRGRGNSEGDFRPLIQEAQDGFDAVEWVARQPYCDGQVAMWGGSYAGYDQWATAKELPPHLATVIPVAAAYAGVDFPIRNNIAVPYIMQWLTFVSGRTLQDVVFADQNLWKQQFRRWFESGAPFKELDILIGNPSSIFQEWISHPERDDYWDNHNPSARQYSKILIPILTITGIYDSDQPGALAHYREHLKNCPDACHFLVIGPWDHAGTRNPKQEFCGLKVGPASLVDLRRLHVEWYSWTMKHGPSPTFLKNNVAYYVMGAEQWRYARSLDSVTTLVVPFYLESNLNPSDVFKSGSLVRERLQSEGRQDCYIYDPNDIDLAWIECILEPGNRTDQRMIYASSGRQLIYHSEPFDKEVEIAGFFKFSAWISIDRPDTDFRVSIYEIDLDGTSTLLSADSIRARYRKSLREAELIRTRDPLRYDFQRFTFVARQMKKGSRLRLAIGPINSIFSQKNYNSGGIVAEESIQEAQPVTVKLWHDESHPSVLHVPFGRSEISRL